MGYGGKSFVPCVHFPMSGRSTARYATCFHHLFGILGRTEGAGMLTRILTDFEPAERSGLFAGWRKFSEDESEMARALFPDGFRVRFSGCLFHYSQAINRW
jgi:hypothetical protein